jgi:hypothetical protein
MLMTALGENLNKFNAELKGGGTNEFKTQMGRPSILNDWLYLLMEVSMIEVRAEGQEWANVVHEDCIFCCGVARHWHKPSNSPICKECAKGREVSEIADAKLSKEKTIAPW